MQPLEIDGWQPEKSVTHMCKAHRWGRVSSRNPKQDVKKKEAAMLAKVKFQLSATPEMSWGRALLVGPKVKKPTIGRTTRAGYLVAIFATFPQLPSAWWREKRARAALDTKTKMIFASMVPSSLGQQILVNNPKWLTRKTAANLQVQMPEQKPSLGRKKQGPFFRKRVCAKDATMYALVMDLVDSVESGSSRSRYKSTQREGKASM